MVRFESLLALGLIARAVQAQSSSAAATTTAAPSCASSIAPKNGEPSVAPGWQVQVVKNELSTPRTILFDSEGHLLVLESGVGVTVMNLTQDEGGCVRADGNPERIINDESLLHGLALSLDGKTLYASSEPSVFAWDYDAAQGRNTSGPREVVSGMKNDDPNDGHVTRTLLVTRNVEGLLLVTKGSEHNYDARARNISTGSSTIKAFNMTNVTDSGYNYPQDGLLLGWGLRNSVGVGEEPITGAIYSVENSVDDFGRDGQNIHENNPGEEMNFHGYLNGTETEEQGGNYGYPDCYAAWNVSEIPDNDGLEVGMQFAIGEVEGTKVNITVNDTSCREDHVAPRLTFAAHMAPLDIKFNSNATAAWVTFHGSWDRTDPLGYKLSVIEFENGSPTAPANSTTAATDIVSNPDLSRCPDNCIRPVNLAWDSRGRLFMTSDSSGEIFVVVRADGGSTDGAGPSSGLPPSPSSSSTAPPPAESTGAAVRDAPKLSGIVAVFAGILALPVV
ncbi:soluble quino protein glucose dehydrogenase [Polyplosphaeria fusca]|uniref:Soluble quino protein glucose dehydrogenase n=1 Tax=Polyplosphaeria fusca TaxID=682080 RepID=A0A9P4V6H8_9PLEO|nr:soluble quino protein glucose dehydrogenase [Polyplosphaeria fusca]